jgi:hypothetical protein
MTGFPMGIGMQIPNLLILNPSQDCQEEMVRIHPKNKGSSIKINIYIFFFVIGKIKKEKKEEENFPY